MKHGSCQSLIVTSTLTLTFPQWSMHEEKHSSIIRALWFLNLTWCIQQTRRAWGQNVALTSQTCSGTTWTLLRHRVCVWWVEWSSAGDELSFMLISFISTLKSTFPSLLLQLSGVWNKLEVTSHTSSAVVTEDFLLGPPLWIKTCCRPRLMFSRLCFNTCSRWSCYLLSSFAVLPQTLFMIAVSQGYTVYTHTPHAVTPCPT